MANSEIKPFEFYSALQSQALLGLKNRQAVVKHIKEGTLRAIVVGGKNGSRRYAIKGKWLKSFLERKKKGLLKSERYTKEELKELLDGTLAYCESKGINTLDELITNLSKLDEKRNN